MEFKDYYKIMGLKPDANADEIKRAYRKLARKYHPDVSKEPDAEARFKEVGEAYEVLKNPDKRKEYDQLRQGGWKQGQEFTPPPGWQGKSGFSQKEFRHEDTGQFSDFFESLFGGGGFKTSTGSQRNFAMAGQDIRYKMEISLQEAFHGGERTIQFQDGNKVRTLKVKIPKGITSGQQIRLAEQGGPGFQGGTNGDLYLEVEIQPNSQFKVEGHNIILTLPITPWEAILGATVTVPTLDGKVQLKIPANSQTGNKLRLKGKGLPGKVLGDQLVELKIIAPKAVTEEQKTLYKKMAAVFGSHSSS